MSYERKYRNHHKNVEFYVDGLNSSRLKSENFLGYFGKWICKLYIDSLTSSVFFPVGWHWDRGSLTATRRPQEQTAMETDTPAARPEGEQAPSTAESGEQPMEH